MKPTIEQVQAEVAALKAMKPKIRRRTAFGDDNHAAVEVQIRVLEGGLDDDDIYGRWDMDEYLLDSAIAAYNWREYGDEEPPSKDWEGLVS